MGFNIPMNTKGALDLSSIGSIMGGTQQTSQPSQTPQMNSYNQPSQTPQMNNYNQPSQTPQQRAAHNSSTGVHLKKGQKFGLTQSQAGLKTIRVGLGWDVLNQACDLDASAFLLGADGKVLGDDWFVFYGQANSPDNSIVHSGDSDGSGYGDDETITINLSQVNPSVNKIAFVVTINEALENNLNFSIQNL